MLPIVLAIAVVSQADDLVVYTVDLKGDPIENIQVQILNSVVASDSNGIARFEVDGRIDEAGSAKIRANMESGNAATRLDPNFIGRVKEIAWGDGERFYSGFVLPMWSPKDVNSMGKVVVTNLVGSVVQQSARTGGLSTLTATRKQSRTGLLTAVDAQPQLYYAVVLQYDNQSVSNTRVIAKHSGDDIDSWIDAVAPDLPPVGYPQLAEELYASLEPGSYLPEHLADEMAFVYAEVDRLDAAARTCRRFPDRAQPQPAPQLPNNMPQPQFPQLQPEQPQFPQPEFPQVQPVPPQVVCMPPPPVVVQYPPRRTCPLCPLGYLSDLFAPRQPQTTYRQDLSDGAILQAPVNPSYLPKFTGSNLFPTTGAISH